MADNPFDHTNYGLRERPVSADWNQLSSQLYMTIREVHRYLHDTRVSNISSAAQSVNSFHDAGLSVVPSSPAAMSVIVSSGLGFLYAPTDIPTNLGATDLESVDDLSPYKPLLVQSPLTFAVPVAPASPNSRIDIIEVRNPRRLENTIPRRQLDPNTLQYDDHVFFKTLAYQIDNTQMGVVTDPASSIAPLSYKVGTAANPGLVPTTSPGYIKIAEILVANTTTSITGSNIVDRRTLLGVGGVVRAESRFRLQWNSGSPTVTHIAMTAPPGVQVSVLPLTAGRGSATVWITAGEIAAASMTVTGASLVGSGPPPMHFGQQVVGGVGSNLVQSLSSGAFTTPATPPIAGAVGQKAATAFLRAYELTAGGPDPNTANVEDVVFNLQFSLSY
jgi:hypothetical protein